MPLWPRGKKDFHYYRWPMPARRLAFHSKDGTLNRWPKPAILERLARVCVLRVAYIYELGTKNMSKIDKLLKRPRTEFESLIGIWQDNSKTPFVLGLSDFIDLSEKIKISQEVIASANNPRLVVLETWLIIDYTIRHLLSHGLQLNRFESSELSFLPLNTKDCIFMLEKFLKNQLDKKENPSRHAIQLPGKFIDMIIRDKVFLDKLLKYEDEYYKKYCPDFKQTPIITITNPEYRTVNEEWLKSVSNLGTKWFDTVRKINEVRNQAAHTFDEDKIYLKLGINGKSKLSKLKKYCKNTLTEAIGVK
jgi:hypothetical protein